MSPRVSVQGIDPSLSSTQANKLCSHVGSPETCGFLCVIEKWLRKKLSWAKPHFLCNFHTWSGSHKDLAGTRFNGDLLECLYLGLPCPFWELYKEWLGFLVGHSCLTMTWFIVVLYKKRSINGIAYRNDCSPDSHRCGVSIIKTAHTAIFFLLSMRDGGMVHIKYILCPRGSIW